MSDAAFTAAALPVLFEVFGEPVNYTSRDTAPEAGDGDSLSITAVREDSTDVGPSLRERDQPTTWWVRASDVSAPKNGDLVTDSTSTVWSVFDSSVQRGGAFKLSTRKGKKR